MKTPSGVNFNTNELFEQIEQLIDRAQSSQERLDQIVELLHARVSHYTWVGVYFLKGNELFLGPFRGKPSPHTRIPLSQGICGAAASQQQTVIVPDVNADDRYLACSIETKSEIVVPIMDGTVCLGEIDIDSDSIDAFTGADQTLIEGVAVRITPLVRELIPTVEV